MYDRLITDYLEGVISAEDEARLVAWINQSEENNVHFRMVEADWEAAHSPSAEAVHMLQMVREQTLRKVARQQARRRRRVWGGVSAFAVAAAVIAAVIMIPRQTMQAPQPATELYTMAAPVGTHSMLSLPDGTTVWLNAGSSLSYGSDFNVRSRDITLKGEAYFEVAHNEGLPFVVYAGDCSFTVLGTKFDISAYTDDPSLQVVLMEGSLRFQSELSTDLMTPGDRIRFNGIENEMVKDKVNAGQYCSWKDGHIVYDKITLPMLVRRLSREYNVDIVLTTEAFNSRNLRVSFTNVESVESVLAALCDIMPVSVTRRGSTFYVNNKQ